MRADTIRLPFRPVEPGDPDAEIVVIPVHEYLTIIRPLTELERLYNQYGTDYPVTLNPVDSVSSSPVKTKQWILATIPSQPVEEKYPFNDEMEMASSVMLFVAASFYLVLLIQKIAAILR